MDTPVTRTPTTILQVGDGQPAETFEAVAEVMDIQGPQLTTLAPEVTAHDSIDGYREFLPTTKWSGTVVFYLDFVPSHATHNETTGLVYLWKNAITRHFRILLAADTQQVIEVSAFVLDLTLNLTVVDRNQARVTLHTTGVPVLYV